MPFLKLLAQSGTQHGDLELLHLLSLAFELHCSSIGRTGGKPEASNAD